MRNAFAVLLVSLAAACTSPTGPTIIDDATYDAIVTPGIVQGDPSVKATRSAMDSHVPVTVDGPSVCLDPFQPYTWTVHTQPGVELIQPNGRPRLAQFLELVGSSGWHCGGTVTPPAPGLRGELTLSRVGDGVYQLSWRPPVVPAGHPACGQFAIAQWDLGAQLSPGAGWTTVWAIAGRGVVPCEAPVPPKPPAPPPPPPTPPPTPPAPPEPPTEPPVPPEPPKMECEEVCVKVLTTPRGRVIRRVVDCDKVPRRLPPRVTVERKVVCEEQ